MFRGVIRSPEAINELENIVAFIAREQPAAAERFVKQFEEHCRDLSDQPRIGSLQNHRFSIDREVRACPSIGSRATAFFMKSQAK